MFDLNDDRCIILEMPAATEETEIDLSGVVKRFTDGFDEASYEQLLRARAVREELIARLYQELTDAEASQEEDLP
jgi:hypothetical protein